MTRSFLNWKQWKFHPTLVAALVCSVFFLLNLVTVDLSPTLFADEPPYADPAANLSLHHCFTSTLWGQPKDAFWAANTPLFQVLLWIAFELGGFGMSQGRICSFILALVSGILLADAARRFKIVKTPGGMILLGCLVSSGFILTNTIRCIRPDTTMMCVASFSFWACSLSSKWRLPLAFLAGALTIFAGLPSWILSALVVATSILFGVLPRARWFYVSFSLGIAGGLAALAAFLSYHHSLQEFLQIILPFTAVGTSENNGLLHRILIEEPFYIAYWGKPFELLDAKQMFDVSYLFLCGSVALACWLYRKQFHKNRSRAIWFTIFLLAVIPLVFCAVAHFRSYYRWMTYLPATLLAVYLFEGITYEMKCHVFARRMCLLLLVPAVLAGAPMRSAMALMEYPRRENITVKKHLACIFTHNSSPVIADRSVYFFVKPYVKDLYLVNLPARGALSKAVGISPASVGLLIINPRDISLLDGIVEISEFSEVQKVGSGVVNSPYNLTVYKRSNQAPKD